MKMGSPRVWLDRGGAVKGQEVEVCWVPAMHAVQCSWPCMHIHAWSIFVVRPICSIPSRRALERFG